MPKAKPVSLFPLSFDEALTMLIKAKPKKKKVWTKHEQSK